MATWLRLNEYGLSQRGYKKFAEYECFEKGCSVLTVRCYKNENGNLLVRTFHSGRRQWTWDEVFTDRDSANKYVASCLECRKWYKKVIWNGQYIQNAKIMRSAKKEGC